MLRQPRLPGQKANTIHTYIHTLSCSGHRAKGGDRRSAVSSLTNKLTNETSLSGSADPIGMCVCVSVCCLCIHMQRSTENVEEFAGCKHAAIAGLRENNATADERQRVRTSSKYYINNCAHSTFSSRPVCWRPDRRPLIGRPVSRSTSFRNATCRPTDRPIDRSTERPTDRPTN